MTYDRKTCSLLILQRLAEGEPLRVICRDDGLPSAGTFLGWVLEDPELAERYTRARASGLDVMADEIVSIADTPEIGQKTVSKATGLEVTEGDMVDHRRLRVEARKWLLAKMAPKKYGEKLAIGGADDLPPIKTMSDDALQARIAALHKKVGGGAEE